VRTIFVLGALLGGACAHQGASLIGSRTPNEFAGCYRMNVRRPVNGWPLPEVVELRVEPSDCLSNQTLTMRAHSSSVLPRHHGHWKLGVDKDIALHWGTDFAGMNATLDRSGVDLSGRATTVRDVGPDGEASEINLQWVKCPAAAARSAAVAGAGHPEVSVPCTPDGLNPSNDWERTVVRNMVRRCEPIDHCLLECLRRGCANNVGGGCFHACSGRGIPPDERDVALLDEATQFRLGTHQLCYPPYK
jgi:hypothetical protein